jgi:hypothetical protein
MGAGGERGRLQPPPGRSLDADTGSRPHTPRRASPWPPTPAGEGRRREGKRRGARMAGGRLCSAAPLRAPQPMAPDARPPTGGPAPPQPPVTAPTPRNRPNPPSLCGPQSPSHDVHLVAPHARENIVELRGGGRAGLMGSGSGGRRATGLSGVGWAGPNARGRRLGPRGWGGYGSIGCAPCLWLGGVGVGGGSSPGPTPWAAGHGAPQAGRGRPHLDIDGTEGQEARHEHLERGWGYQGVG